MNREGTHKHHMTISSLFKSSGWTCCLLGLLASAWTWSEPNISKFSRQAEKLFSEGLYSDAAPFYSEALSFAVDDTIKMELTRRLATCYVREGKPRQALALLSSSTPLQNNHSFYLMSLAHRQLGETHAALDFLNHCTPIEGRSQEKTMIALEKGYHFFHLGDWSSAQQLFSSIILEESNPLPYQLAQLHLAKIHLLNHQEEKALETLNLLSSSLPPGHPLNLEKIYLKGWTLLAMHQEAGAVLCFEELLPQALASKTDWSVEVLQALIASLLNQALTSGLPPEQITPLISKAEETLNQLIARAPTETSYLLMNDFYLIKAKTLSDPQAYVQAQELLERPNLFSSEEGLRQALLKKAEAAPAYPERSQLYERLSTDPNHPPSFRAKASFLKGVNAFDEGLKWQKLLDLEKASLQFERAAQAFDQTRQLAQACDPALTAHALKHQAIALAQQPETGKAKEGWGILLNLISDPALFSKIESPQEIYHLAGWIALRIKEPEYLAQGEQFLNKGQNGPSAEWDERCLKLEGMLSLQSEKWKQADALFARFLLDYPSSASLGEVWFWRAYGAERMNSLSLKKEYLQNAYTQDPLSPYAPIAYFHYHSWREYMHGSRKAIKHLQAMPLLFPSHPLLITAHYLIGLSQKKDHLSDEGQIVRRKDWTTAIEAFHLTESTFDNLLKKNLIPPQELSYYLQIRTRAQLERAQANFAIAKSSKGGKRQIYLEYAETVFKDLIHDFTAPHSLVKEKLVASPYPKAWAEAELKLAQLYEEKENPEKAEALLNDSLKHYQEAQIAQAYGLMNVWLEKGKLAQKRKEEGAALQCFIEAEKAAGDFTGLSPNEKLDLWIQQSICYSSLHQFDPAMVLLSRVINDDVISPLRIKAMYLRAEIYEKEERPELAIKQLEATARKGGEWAQKAQEKLEKTYGYK